MNEHGNIWLMTGPNIIGKSTLRQIAIIALLNQIGSYVREKVSIGILIKFLQELSIRQSF